MALSDLTLPATSAEELGVEAGSPRVARVVAAASAIIVRFLRRAQVHYQAGIVEKVPGYGRPRLVLEVTPLISVTSVAIDGSIIDPSEYSIEDANAGLLYRLGGWPFTGLARAGLPGSDLLTGSEKPGIDVTYTAGWVTPAQAASSGWAGPARSLPADIEEACLRLASSLYRSGGEAENVVSESLGAYSVTYAAGVSGQASLLSSTIRELLAPYVRPL